MSTWRADSELSTLNRQADQSEWTELSPALFEVIQRAQEISAMTDGAFDVTIGPVVNLWGFGPQARRKQSASEAELAEVMAVTGWEYRELVEQVRAICSTEHQYMYI